MSIPTFFSGGLSKISATDMSNAAVQQITILLEAIREAWIQRSSAEKVTIICLTLFLAILIPAVAFTPLGRKACAWIDATASKTRDLAINAMNNIRSGHKYLLSSLKLCFARIYYLASYVFLQGYRTATLLWRISTVILLALWQIFYSASNSQWVRRRKEDRLFLRIIIFIAVLGLPCLILYLAYCTASSFLGPLIAEIYTGTIIYLSVAKIYFWKGLDAIKFSGIAIAIFHLSRCICKFWDMTKYRVARYWMSVCILWNTIKQLVAPFWMSVVVPFLRRIQPRVASSFGENSGTETCAFQSGLYTRCD